MNKLNIAMIFIALLLVNSIYAIYCLNIQQWKYINNIIKHDSTDDKLKTHVRDILLTHNIPWAHYRANIFLKSTHTDVYFKTRENEIYEYAVHGLMSGIRNFNGSSNFYSYVTPYVKGSLYRGVTELKGITLLPHHYRVNKKWKLEPKNKQLYTRSIYAHTLYQDSSYQIHSQAHTPFNFAIKHNIMIEDILNTLGPADKRIFKLRYDLDTMNVIRSFEQVAHLSGYSPEYTRRKIIKINNVIEIHFNKYEI